MIISTDNDNNFSLTIMLPGNDGAASRYETNVNVCPIGVAASDSQKPDFETHVSTMTVRGASASKVSLNTAEESQPDIQPEDFEFVSHQTQLMEGMNGLRLNGHLLDVKLWAEGQCFKAHRVVLSACSDYFRAMFTEPMKERNQDDIYLSGISAMGLELVLEYIYTSKLSLNLANIQAVLSTATHLQVLQVIGACSGYLRRQLDEINCVDVITLAENYALPKLRKVVYNFISEHFTSQLITRLSLDQLDHLLGGDYPINATELSILESVLEWLLRQSDQTMRKKATAALLCRIDYGQIRKADLFTLSSKQNENLEKILTDKGLQVCDTLTKLRDDQGLLNLRGMQLSIVKVGGFGPLGITNKIAYFNSYRNSWLSLTSIPHIECSNFGYAVLQNSLYVIGGCFNQSESTLSEHIHPFGFSYNPRKDYWDRIAPMNRERCRFTLTPINSNQLIAIGGCGNNEGSVIDGDDQIMNGLEDFESTAELYDCRLDRWQYLPSLPNGGRSQHAASKFGDDQILVSGGLDSNFEVLNDCLLLNLNSNEWSGVTSLPLPRADHVMINVGQEDIIVVGGWTYNDQSNQRQLIDTIDKYSLKTGVWEVEARVPTPRFHPGVSLIGKKLHIVGGFHSDSTFDRATGLVEVYDLETKQWSKTMAYPEDTWEHACVALHVPIGRNEDMNLLEK